MKKILVTGGAGYIGSHTILKLLKSQYDVVTIDNLSNSSYEVINRIKFLANKNFDFIEGDICDKYILKTIFSKYKIDNVIHFAGLKSSSESNEMPLKYYENNVVGSLTLFNEMANYGVNKIVFSSSATVYGEPAIRKCNENSALCPISVYGKSKLLIENILQDIKKAQPEWRVVNLRYFNPIGAHPSGLIGEDPRNVPNNLIPFLTQVAMGKREHLLVFGDTYETSDGTGKRDYIHVEDLVSGHIAALNNIEKAREMNININLGTGRSYSVLEVISAFEKCCGKKIPFKIVGKRLGDVSELYADISFAKRILGWEAKFNINEMCEDAWRWQQMNPEGFSNVLKIKNE